MTDSFPIANGASPLKAPAAREGEIAPPMPGAVSPSAGGPIVSADMASPQQQALPDITKPCQGGASETAADEDSGPHPGGQAAPVRADSLMQAPAGFDTDGVDVICLQPAQVRPLASICSMNLSAGKIVSLLSPHAVSSALRCCWCIAMLGSVCASTCTEMHVLCGVHATWW